MFKNDKTTHNKLLEQLKKNKKEFQKKMLIEHKSKLQSFANKKDFFELFNYLENSVKIYLFKLLLEKEDKNSNFIMALYEKPEFFKFFMENHTTYLKYTIVHPITKHLLINDSKVAEKFFQNVSSFSFPALLNNLKIVSLNKEYERLYQKYRLDCYLNILKLNKNEVDNRDLVGIQLIFDDIFKRTNTTLKDLEYLTTGCYTDVFILKDLVIKTGNERFVFKIPISPYVLRPLFRRYFNNIKRYIEIAPLLNTKNVPFNEVKEIFSSLKKINQEWLDPKTKNIGQLNNIPNYYGLNLSNFY